MSPKVVSLKLAKKMKELGYKQEGLWWWVEFSDEARLMAYEGYLSERRFGTLRRDLKCYVAPTVAELGEALPENLRVGEVKLSRIEIHYEDNSVDIFHESTDGKYTVFGNVIGGKSEVEARANMWLYLQKEGGDIGASHNTERGASEDHE